MQYPLPPAPASATFAPQLALDLAQPRAFHNPYPFPDTAFRFKWDDEDDEEDEEDDEEEEERARRGKGKGRLGGARAPGACDPCKQSKVKCVFPLPGQPCRRCAHGGHDCRVSGRKQKPRPPSHSELVERLHAKDRVIYGLLLPQPRDPAADLPAGLARPITSASTSEHDPDDPHALPVLPVWDKRTPKHEVERRVEAWIDEARARMMRWGPGTRDLYGPAQDPGATPDILTSGLVSPREVDQLFALFYDKINISFTICDPVLHTPSRLLRTSPFLYTTICAVASRHFPSPSPSTLYPRLIHAAKQAAAAALNGPKSIETCQAYLLLGVFHPPPRTFVEDRTFLYLGLGIRMATDLELHLPPRPARFPHPASSAFAFPTSPTSPTVPFSSRPLSSQSHPHPPSEHTQRHTLNRNRIWLNCFCLDRSISTQLGKPSAIAGSGCPFPFALEEWWKASEFNSPQDIHMCAYAQLLQVVSAFHDVVCADAYEGGRGAGKKLDLKLVQACADQIKAVGEDWTRRLAENSAKRPHPVTHWRDNLWPFLVSYAKLVVFSTGLQDGMRQGLRRDNPFSDQCIDAATEILTRVTEKLAKLGYLRYCVEAYFLFMGFAAAFLLKILRPNFSFMMRAGREHDIIQLVQRLIDLLGSDEVAIDERHTPRLYSRFLADVLAKHKRDRDERARAMEDVSAAPAHTAAAAFPPAPPAPPPPPPDQTWMYDLFRGQPYHDDAMQMQLDADAPAANTGVYAHAHAPASAPSPDDMMLASMAAITDPQFWEQGTMPGFSWAAGAGAGAGQQWGGGAGGAWGGGGAAGGEGGGEAWSVSSSGRSPEGGYEPVQVYEPFMGRT